MRFFFFFFSPSFSFPFLSVQSLSSPHPHLALLQRIDERLLRCSGVGVGRGRVRVWVCWRRGGMGGKVGGDED